METLQHIIALALIYSATTIGRKEENIKLFSEKWALQVLLITIGGIILKST